MLRYTGTARLVTVQLAVAKQRLARTGVAVQVRLPDGRTGPGRVDRVYTVIDRAGAPDSALETRIEALITLTDPAAPAGIEAAVVAVVHRGPTSKRADRAHRGARRAGPLGVLVTAGYAAYQTWPAVVPAWASAGALAATVVIGGLAGLYPAIRAARLSPTAALSAA